MTSRPNMIDVILEKLEEERLWEERQNNYVTESNGIYIKSLHIVRELRARGIQNIQLPHCSPYLGRRDIFAILGPDRIYDAIEIEVFDTKTIRMFPPPKSRFRTNCNGKQWLDVRWDLLDFNIKLERILKAYYWNRND